MTLQKRSLGVCYYPEHWHHTQWANDAGQMVDLGLTWVRVGEFSWAQVEPKPDQLSFGWLDDAVGVLGDAGLKVVMGTPTATPPRWMLDKHPDMLAYDAQGQPRKFGSRRHYCFSHIGYQKESARIVGLYAQRYGQNPHVAAWQTDNEYGCHDTVISYSPAARAAFVDWLAHRYGTIDALNTAWGNQFWSMNYNNFDQIDLPNLTVTEANPAHRLAFMRFCSDQVVRFNKQQVDIIRQHSDAPITHNYMGRITDFDHFKLGEDLDFASWDSYPIGFLEDRVPNRTARHPDYTRQGDPDFQAFHHDLYRAVGKGRSWVMEQQPGPVNWAPYNPAPLPGMVKLWSWEAFAHGAETVCYFRWRQAPMAQEQLHAGLRRSDDQPATAWAEVSELVNELQNAQLVAPRQAKVALIFDYQAQWAWDIQPHGQGLSYFELIYDYYVALRQLGQSIDIIGPNDDLAGYRLIVASGLMHMPDALKERLSQCDALVIYGPRSAARDADFNIPTPLPPDLSGMDITVDRVESLRPDTPIALQGGGAAQRYREFLTGQGDVIVQSAAGAPIAMRNGLRVYVAACLDDLGMTNLLRPLCVELGLSIIDLPGGLRVRDTATERFWINYDQQAHHIDELRIDPISVYRQIRPAI